MQPRDSVKITAMVVPETIGKIDAIIKIGLNKKVVYMIPIKANVIANRFSLEPLYFTYVNLGETVEYKLEIKNELVAKLHPLVMGAAGATPIDKDLNI